jgi:hypothetical protein
LESQLATRNIFHLIIATEMRRNFTDASCELSLSKFMRELFLIIADVRQLPRYSLLQQAGYHIVKS